MRAGLLVLAAARLGGGREAGCSQETEVATKVAEQVTSLTELLGDICTAMCKEVQAYPNCAGCPNFKLPPPPPSAMTFDELLPWMDNLGHKARDELRELKSKAG